MKLWQNSDAEVIVSILWKPIEDERRLTGEGVVIARRLLKSDRGENLGEFIVWHVVKLATSDSWACYNGDYYMFRTDGKDPKEEMMLDLARRKMMQRAKRLAPKGYLVGPKRG